MLISHVHALLRTIVFNVQGSILVMSLGGLIWMTHKILKVFLKLKMLSMVLPFFYETDLNTGH